MLLDLPPILPITDALVVAAVTKYVLVVIGPKADTDKRLWRQDSSSTVWAPGSSVGCSTGRTPLLVRRTTRTSGVMARPASTPVTKGED